MSYGNMPGPGDEASWGPITSPRDPRCNCDEDEHDRALESIAEHIADERMASAEWVADAQGAFSQLEYDEITAAILAGDPMKVGRMTIEATRRAIRRDAEKEAPHRLAKLIREDQEDAALARSGVDQ